MIGGNEDDAPIPTGDFANALKRGDIPIDTGEDKKRDKTPIFKMLGDSRIPVSKHLGKLWKSRRDAGQARRESSGVTEAWEQAVAYYKNDQLSHRNSGDPDFAQNNPEEVQEQFTETENVVYANTSALTPALYSKNPVVEYSSDNPEQKPMMKRLEKLVNALFAKRDTPGLALKLKAKKAIVLANLTNNAWMETGWVTKEDSSEQAFAELDALAKRYSEAKDIKELREIEGEMLALETKVDMLRPSGPYARLRKPQDILVDPSSEEPDYSDAQWMMDFDYINTELLKALYTEKKDGAPMSIFQPTHVVKLKGKGSNSEDPNDEVNNFVLIEKMEENSWRKHGFEDEDAYKKSLYTRVCRVWDKATRRVLLFNNNDWSWPLWVWDDPFGYPGFYPFDLLSFVVDPMGDETKGEVVYYLDQQDAINEINSEKRLARSWARRNWYYDKNKISPDDIDMIMRGKKQGAVGIDVPDGASLDDFFKAMVPPSAEFMQMFDKQSIYDAIDRVSSVRGVMRGAEFRTNTTNEAIKRYDAVSETRLDEKVDALEDFIGQIGQRVGYLCLRFMSPETVASIIGPSADGEAGWTNLPQADAAKISCTVVGGSTQKASSSAKQQMALQVGQTLGQFARATPVALVIALKVMEEAFDTMVIEDADWQMIRQSIEQQLQGQQGEGGDLAAMFDQLPPEAKKAFGDATARGAPAAQVLQAIQQKLQGGGQQSAPNPNANPEGVA